MISPQPSRSCAARLKKLADELDRYLAGEYGVDPSKTKAYDQWRKSHQPFHWFAEFYGIMSQGGFDVIIGNPPYVESAKILKQYTFPNLTMAEYWQSFLSLHRKVHPARIDERIYRGHFTNKRYFNAENVSP